MSIHKSLVARARLKRHRNVLTRIERILELEQDEKWSEEENSIFALPKVRVAKAKKAHGKKKEATEEKPLEGAEAAETAEAAQRPQGSAQRATDAKAPPKK